MGNGEMGGEGYGWRLTRTGVRYVQEEEDQV